MAGDNRVLVATSPSFPKQMTLAAGEPYIVDCNGKTVQIAVLSGGANVAHSAVSGLSPSADPTITAAGSSFSVATREQLVASGAGVAVIYATVT